MTTLPQVNGIDGDLLDAVDENVENVSSYAALDPLPYAANRLHFLFVFAYGGVRVGQADNQAFERPIINLLLIICGRVQRIAHFVDSRIRMLYSISRCQLQSAWLCALQRREFDEQPRQECHCQIR